MDVNDTLVDLLIDDGFKEASNDVKLSKILEILDEGTAAATLIIKLKAAKALSLKEVCMLHAAAAPATRLRCCSSGRRCCCSYWHRSRPCRRHRSRPCRRHQVRRRCCRCCCCCCCCCSLLLPAAAAPCCAESSKAASDEEADDDKEEEEEEEDDDDDVDDDEASAAEDKIKWEGYVRLLLGIDGGASSCLLPKLADTLTVLTAGLCHLPLGFATCHRALPPPRRSPTPGNDRTAPT